VQFKERDKVVQKVMMSLEMTERVMERVYHPSMELAPCWSQLQKWEMMGGEGERFSNPSVSAWPVGFKGSMHACAAVAVLATVRPMRTP